MDDEKQVFIDVNIELRKALQYHQAGQLQKAEIIYRKILEANPNHADALHFLGVIAYQVGRHEITIELISKAISHNPYVPDYYGNIGAAFVAQGRLEEAISAFQRAIQLKPDYIEACYNLGVVLMDLVRLEEAVSAFQRAIQLKPDYAEAYNNLGNVLQAQGKIEEAIFSYQRAIQLKPDYAEAYNNLGNALREQAKVEEAVSAFQRAIQLKPDYAEAYNNLGIVFLLDQGKIEEAVSAYQRALQLKPDYIDAHSNYLMAMHYDSRFTKETVLKETLNWSKRHCSQSYYDKSFNNTVDPECRIRVGYISGDFRRHPVGYFIEAVLTHHNRETFEVYCYNSNHEHDDVTKRLQSLPIYWRSIVGVSDEKAEKMVTNDGIDILIDLSGHSFKNRLLLFARKPAPIQATWIGYFDTIGIQAMDYIIADRYLIPEEEEDFYVEKVARLPDYYLCYAPPAHAPEVNEPPCLSRGYITFGCFNNIAKVNPDVVAVWSKILRALPGSRICLKTLGLRSAAVKNAYMQMFLTNGIEQDRVDLLERSPYHEYFAYYGNIDIVLDTFPFTGNTTTFEALWMGVPVPTLVHNTFVGRFGLSILSALDLNELIAFTQDDYIEKVLHLAGNVEKLSALRLNLRSKMHASPLCDGEKFTMNLERIYRGMWRGWCEKQVSR